MNQRTTQLMSKWFILFLAAFQTRSCHCSHRLVKFLVNIRWEMVADIETTCTFLITAVKTNILIPFEFFASVLWIKLCLAQEMQNPVPTFTVHEARELSSGVDQLSIWRIRWWTSAASRKRYEWIQESAWSHYWKTMVTVLKHKASNGSFGPRGFSTKVAYLPCHSVRWGHSVLY